MRISDWSSDVCSSDLLFLAPTALQRLFHWQGERAVLRAAANAGTVAGISSLATIGLAEAGALTDGPKLFQLYVHHDEGLNQAMLDAAREAKFDAVALTVDTIVGGSRERCLRSGFPPPPRFTARNLLRSAAKHGWSSEARRGGKTRSSPWRSWRSPAPKK